MPPPVAETIDNVKDFASRALDDTRRLILDLRPSVLDDLGLISALRQYAGTHLEPLGISYTVEPRQLQERLPPAVELTMFRILQEAINNCARHAAASEVRIRIEQDKEGIRAQVEDDGRGFDTWAVLDERDGKPPLAILGMRERAALAGGQLTIATQPGHGTRVSVSVPVEILV